MNSGAKGYFGGTFDPPHLGHLILAAEARFQLHLATVYWIITPDPPHKSGRTITDQGHRLKMLEMVTGDGDHFQISDVDLRRAPPHYAADTVEILKSEDPESELVYIIGEDSLKELPTWVEPDRLLAAVDRLAVYPRPGVQADLDELDLLLPGIKQKTVLLEGSRIEISSSRIRTRAAAGEPYRHFLSPPVAEYIRSNNLYLP